MVEVTFHALGRFKRSVTLQMKRPSAEELCRRARKLGGFYGGELLLELKADSRPDCGGGLFVFKPLSKPRSLRTMARVVGLVVWVEVDDDSCDMEAGA